MRFTLIILALFGLFLLTGCSQKRPARINHIVFFKLKDPGDTTELIRDCDRDLADIPGVTSYYCGQHGDFGRKNVQTDYDVGFYVGFESDEAYQAYLADPNHVAIVGKWKPRWEWIRIYDVVDNTP
ncbi:MAG: Dabb family protein [Planctomycetota bacterium]|nr:Dabb family protein [Planctomycetota bacterium]